MIIVLVFEKEMMRLIYGHVWQCGRCLEWKECFHDELRNALVLHGVDELVVRLLGFGGVHGGYCVYEGKFGRKNVLLALVLLLHIIHYSISIVISIISKMVTVSEVQHGSIPEKGTIHAMLMMRKLQEECHADGKRCICVLLTWRNLFTEYQVKCLSG